MSFLLSNGDNLMFSANPRPVSRSGSRLTHRKACAWVLVAQLLSALVRGQRGELIDYRAGQEEERIFHFKMF